MGDTSDDTYENYMRVCDQFKLGELTTESPNPISANLSSECQQDLQLGLETLQNVDRAAMEAMLTLPSVAEAKLLEQLAHDVHDTFVAGRTVFMVGCGATGRLSLSLEVFCREGMIEEQYRDQVKGFMAGGDVALIRSIEKFEDREEFGRQQLRDLGFQDGDLILAITEGGETPFVIAAGEEGTLLSPSRRHYFLYCNPDETLRRVAERSRRVLDNERFVKINLTHGPMAVTGSTRMQATTVQLLAAGLAIQHHANPAKIQTQLQLVASTLTKGIRYADVAPFTAAEAALYEAGAFFLYETDVFTLTVMTDTTERSPTFSFPPFENFDLSPPPPPSPVYLHLPGVNSSREAWERLLRRKPRGIDWEETRAQTAAEVLYGYDFSDRCVSERANRYGSDRTGYTLSVNRADAGIVFSIPAKNVQVIVPLAPEVLGDVLLSNVVAKALLNAHSTAIMARNGRLRGNVMVYVRPTNNKLIDRAARYVQLLLAQRRGSTATPMPSYAEIVRTVYETRAEMAVDQPVVVGVVDKFLSGR